jgi:methionyl-tRNA synthetase
MICNALSVINNFLNYLCRYKVKQLIIFKHIVMQEPKRYLITAALPYANGPLHIGHIAGAYLPADVYVRYLKLKGKDVAFICGSDEHGVPITLRARKEGVSPQEIVDRYHKINEQAFKDLGIEFDIYHRTSDSLHHKTASDFFKKLYEQGEFVEKEDEQFYDEKEQQYLADRYIVGTCPKCNYENAYGDQCEQCGTSLSPKELINPQSALSGNEPVLKKTKHWYLPLDKYQEEWLEDWIDSHKNDWKPNVYGQCKSWLSQGLKPRAVTRDLEWGVPVPLEGANGKVLYVWFDAPIGYISATKAWAEEQGKNWEDYWKDEESSLIHFIGKDNIVFHCLIFPSMLKAHGDYILPDNVPANEFLNLEGRKLSTSRNWAVWVNEFVEDFPGKEDVLRYTICANFPEQKDNDFTWKDFQNKNNNELVAVLGNFVNRALVLTKKYFDKKVPERNELTDYDKEILEKAAKVKEDLENRLENYKFREAVKIAMDMGRLGNKYLADTEPWSLYEKDPERVATILNISLQITASLSIIIEPFMPFTAEKLRKFLNIDKLNWELAGTSDILSPGHEVNKPKHLFQKIEDKEVDQQVEKLKEAQRKIEQEEKGVEPAKEDISFEDFTKLDIRTGTVLEAEKVPKTKKLLKLKVDTGLDERTVVSGIAEYFSPEDIKGKQVSIVVNLAPKKIKGIKSHGMILMAENADGKLVFISPDESMQNGSMVK